MPIFITTQNKFTKINEGRVSLKQWLKYGAQRRRYLCN